MISLIIAGGVYVAATSQATQWPDIDNHTLRGEAIPSSEVICRTMWGTPMLPDGKGGYSLIAPINQSWIKESLIIPPKTTEMVAYRPLPPMVEIIERPRIPLPVAPAVNPQGSAPAPAPATEAPPAEALPVENSAPVAPAPAAPAPEAPAPEAPAPSTGTSDGFAPATGN